MQIYRFLWRNQKIKAQQCYKPDERFLSWQKRIIKNTIAKGCWHLVCHTQSFAFRIQSYKRKLAHLVNLSLSLRNRLILSTTVSVLIVVKWISHQKIKHFEYSSIPLQRLGNFYLNEYFSAPSMELFCGKFPDSLYTSRIWISIYDGNFEESVRLIILLDAVIY